MSGNSLDIKRYPQILHESKIKEMLLAIIHSDEEETSVAGGVLADLACKGAIKVNQSLNMQEMEKLVTELFKTTNPHFCPHQRPITISLDSEEIEKRLKRR